MQEEYAIQAWLMQEYHAGNDNHNDSWFGGKDMSHWLMDKVFQTPTLIDPGISRDSHMWVEVAVSYHGQKNSFISSVYERALQVLKCCLGILCQ